MSFYEAIRRAGAVTMQAVAVLFAINAGLLTYSLYYEDRRSYQEEKGRADAEREKAAKEIAARCKVLALPGETLGRCLAREIKAYEEMQAPIKIWKLSK